MQFLVFSFLLGSKSVCLVKSCNSWFLILIIFSIENIIIDLDFLHLLGYMDGSEIQCQGSMHLLAFPRSLNALHLQMFLADEKPGDFSLSLAKKNY